MFLKTIANYKFLFLVIVLVAGFIFWFKPAKEDTDIYSAKPGQPIPGLTDEQKRLFAESEIAFKHDFTPDEGLGPLFGGTSCFECHGKPLDAGLEGKDVSTTGVVRIGALLPSSPLNKDLKKARETVDLYNFSALLDKGGPVLLRRTITQEFPNKYPPDCIIEFAVVPPEAQFTSLRHSPPVMGLGLIDAIDESVILDNMMKQAKQAPELMGRTNPNLDPLTQTTKIGRFGWKCQGPNVLLFVSDAMNGELGVTTYIQSLQRSARGIIDWPKCIRPHLPREPNDLGKNLVTISYFLSTLAPPPKPILNAQAKEGQEIFVKLKCAVCHTPELSTAPYVEVADPRSPLPKLNYIEIKALENQPVRLYSDLLLHPMGPELADGIVQVTAIGGEFRTTPLWGLKYKKFLLHDGRAKTINEAIMAHGGQAQEVKEAYAKLPPDQKEALLAFLRAL